MSRIYTAADQLIGHTPLLELTHLEQEFGLKARIVAKLEYFNPAGSVKDRIAKAMIDDAEAKGLLKPGSVIIELQVWHFPLISLHKQLLLLFVPMKHFLLNDEVLQIGRAHV